MSACALEATLAGAATASPSLPLSSSSSRSAVFLPMPGTLISRPLSCRLTARASSSTDSPERIDSAVRGPTPEILTSRRKVARSSWVRKPNSICASSRTTKWVSSVTRSPSAGQVVEAAHRHVDFVADAVDVDEHLRRRLGREGSGESADHGGDYRGALFATLRRQFASARQRPTDPVILRHAFIPPDNNRLANLARQPRRAPAHDRGGVRGQDPAPQRVVPGRGREGPRRARGRPAAAALRPRGAADRRRGGRARDPRGMSDEPARRATGGRRRAARGRPAPAHAPRRPGRAARRTRSST